MLSSNPDAIDHSGHLYMKNHICENLFPSWIHGHKFLHIYLRLFYICLVIIFQYVSKLHTKLRKMHIVHQLQVEIGELKGRLTEVVSNCDSLCKRITVEGPESLHSSVKPFTRLSSMSKDPPLPLWFLFSSRYINQSWYFAIFSSYSYHILNWDLLSQL